MNPLRQAELDTACLIWIAAFPRHLQPGRASSLSLDRRISSRLDKLIWKISPKSHPPYLFLKQEKLHLNYSWQKFIYLFKRMQSWGLGTFLWQSELLYPSHKKSPPTSWPECPLLQLKLCLGWVEVLQTQTATEYHEATLSLCAPVVGRRIGGKKVSGSWVEIKTVQ